MAREVLLLVNSQGLPDTDALQATALLQDFTHAQRHHRPVRRRQFLAGRLLLRAQLEAVSGIPAAAWKIGQDRNGRPLVIGPSEETGPDISVSHSGDRVAAATATHGRIGIDIEVARAARPADAFAEVALSSVERDIVAREGQTAFLRFWTLREAIGKANGEGFSAALAIDGQALITISEAPVLTELHGIPYVLAHRALTNGSLAVAWMLTEEIAGDPVAQLAAALAGIGAEAAGC